MQKGKYYYPTIMKDGKRTYLHKGPNDIGKSSIPIKDRCEDFDALWMMVFDSVMENWEEVKDIHEFDQYQQINEDE